MGIAKDKVEGTVVFGRSGFGSHLDAAATWALIFCRIRILIDFDLLDCRRRNSEVVNLHSVYDERDSIRACTAGIKKSRHRANVILIEYRQVAQRLLAQGDGIFVVRSFR